MLEARKASISPAVGAVAGPSCRTERAAAAFATRAAASRALPLQQLGSERSDVSIARSCGVHSLDLERSHMNGVRAAGTDLAPVRAGPERSRPG